jgi:biopolymer transport protein ExbD
MARNFHRRRAQHAIADINVTNLIDLAFILLVVFMIVTPLMQQEQAIQVNLPTESRRPQEEPDKDLTFQSISIDRDGTYFFGSEQVDFDELPARLSELAGRTKVPVIRIRADLTLQFQQVVRLMDEIKKHNLTKITFDTQAVE